MASPKHTRLETPRKCLDCGADISHRGVRAKRCELCAEERNQELKRQGRKNDKARSYTRKWRQENRDRSCEIARQWARNNPERAKEHARRTYQKNKEKRLESGRRYRKENAAKVREFKRRWERNNPDKASKWKKNNPEAVQQIVRECHRRRRAQKRNQGGVVSRNIDALLMERQKSRCVAPGCGVSLAKTGHHLDHIIPLAKGGMHEDANLQLLCPPCNHQKSAMMPEDFARRRGMLV